MSASAGPAWTVGPWGFPVVDESAIDYAGNAEALSVASEAAEAEWYCAQPVVDRLDLTTPANSRKGAARPEKYGKGGITGYGRKMVKSAATLIQKIPGKRLTFATVTMPPLPAEMRRELALLWPDLVHRLLEWLGRRLKSQGLPPAIVSVSEIQPGRLEKYLEAYLHLHLVWPNHHASFGNWAVSAVDVKTWCSEYLQRKGVWTADAWVNVDVQRVKKTAAGYLAKYMSKGSEEIEKFAQDCGWDAIPGQWWNMTKTARQLVKKYTREGDEVGALLESVVYHALECQELDPFYVLQPAIVDYDGKERIAGWYGVMTQDLRRQLVSMLA